MERDKNRPKGKEGEENKTRRRRQNGMEKAGGEEHCRTLWKRLMSFVDR